MFAIKQLIRIQRGNVYQSRNLMRKHWVKDHLKDLWHRRQLVGPEEAIARSSYPNWNYDAELFAFAKRLGEDVPMSNLRQIFNVSTSIEDAKYIDTNNDHLALQSASISGVPVGGARALQGQSESQIEQHQLTCSELVARGQAIIEEYLKAYLRCHLRRLPEEGISGIYQFLTSPPMLHHISSHLGFKDLIQIDNPHVPESLVTASFQAFIALLEEEQSLSIAEKFILDFIVPQLIGENINDYWQLTNPMGTLVEVLANQGRGAPEPRLLRQAGMNTVTPVYMVGVYSDKELIGEGAGETTCIAEDIAARYALQTIFRTREQDVCFTYQPAPDATSTPLDQLDECRHRSNKYLADLCDSLAPAANLLAALHLDDLSGQEPIDPKAGLIKYKKDTEEHVGAPYRRRLNHKFHKGSYFRKTKRIWAQPKAALV